MRAVVQRVSHARVTVDGGITGEIADGLMILLGVGRDDTSDVAISMAEKIANLRIFEDNERKMNRSLLDVNGSALVVSQFTLYGDARGQRRPSFVAAAPLELAKKLYEEFTDALRKFGNHGGDRSFRRDDVGGISQRRAGDNPPRLRQSILEPVSTFLRRRRLVFRKRAAHQQHRLCNDGG